MLARYATTRKDCFELHTLVTNVGSLAVQHINCKLEIQSRTLEGFENDQPDKLHPIFLYNYWKLPGSPLLSGRPLLPGMATFLRRSPAVETYFHKHCHDPENEMQFTLSADNMPPMKEILKVSTFEYATASTLLIAE